MRFTQKLGYGRRGGVGLMLGIVAPLLIVTGCTAENESSGPAAGGTAAATASSVSKAPATTAPSGGGQTQAPGSPGGGGDSDAGGGAGTPGTGGAQTNAPGGTDTCGATPCGVTDTPAPGGTDTCGATPCGVTEPSQPAPVLWDPCSISAADIGAQGLRPESETEITGPTDDRNCRWVSPSDTWELTIVSTRTSVEGIQATGKYQEFTPVSMGSRTGFQFRALQDTNRIGCYVGLRVPFGSVLFVTRNLQKDALADPCSSTVGIADNLVKYLH